MTNNLFISDKFFELDSGLKVSTLLVPTAPFVHLTLTLRKGVGSERQAQYGYLALLSTLFSRGCGELNRAEFATDCDRRGANLQFYPGRDFLTFEFWVLPEDLAWSLQTLKKMIWNPRLDSDEVEVAREEQILQLRARKDEKKARLSDSCREAFYAIDHPYARPLLGDIESLKQVTPSSIGGFHQQFLDSIGAALCVTGGFEQKALEGLIAEHFSSLPFSMEEINYPQFNDAFRSENSAALQLSFPVEQAEILIAMPALSRLDSRYRLAQFCNEVFGGAFLSRLTRAVRMREGMAYSADSRLAAGLEAGVLWIGLQTDRHKVRAALRTVRECMEELRTGGIEQEEFSHFKDFVRNSLPFDYDALADLTSRRLEQILFGESWTLESRIETFNSTVNLRSANNLLAEMLRPERALVCVLGDNLEAEVASSFHESPGKTKSSAPLSLVAGPKADEGVSVAAELLHEHPLGRLYRYPNGVRLLALPRRELASVSLQIWTITGSMDEAPGATGVSHLLEHLMFRGTEKHPDGHFDAILAQRGGLNNAFTTEDFTVYVNYLTQDGLEEALCLEADRFSRLLFTEELFRTELSVVLEERALRVDCNPLGKAYEKLQHLAFGELPYGHPVIGWKEDLEKMTLGTLHSHYLKATEPSRLLIVVAGGCDFEQALKLAGNTFGTLPQNSKTQNVWPVFASSEPVTPLKGEGFEMRERSGYSYLLMCYRFPREGHPDYEACELLSRILGEGDSAHLYDTFVRQRRKVMEVWINYESQSRDHPLLLLGLAAPQSIDSELRHEVSDYLCNLHSRLTQDELEKARRTWLAEEAFSTDELEDWALDIAGRVVLLPWNDVWAQKDKIFAVGLEDVKRVSRTYLKEDSLVHVLLHGDSSSES